MTIAADPLDHKLAEVVASWPRARIPIEALRSAALASDSSLAGSSDARQRLLGAILRLEARRICRIPAGQDLWEQLPRPALPRWVMKPAPVRRPLLAPPPVTWHSSLGWAALGYQTGDWTEAETRLLLAVNAFIIAGGAQRLVPIAERSLRLLGDEKAINPLARGRLFTPGRLSLELLGAVRTPPPFTWARVGDGPVLLVVENSATYWTLTHANREVDSPLGIVAFGQGNHFPSAVEYIVDLPTAAGVPGLTQIRYFGDLDEEGLDIASRSGTAAHAAGLPPVLPAVGLYSRLFALGVRAPGRAVARKRAEALAAWLGPTLASEAVATLLAGLRIAQESVGTDQLAGDASWSSMGSLGACDLP